MVGRWVYRRKHVASTNAVDIHAGKEGLVIAFGCFRVRNTCDNALVKCHNGSQNEAVPRENDLTLVALVVALALRLVLTTLLAASLRCMRRTACSFFTMPWIQGPLVPPSMAGQLRMLL